MFYYIYHWRGGKLPEATTKAVIDIRGEPTAIDVIWLDANGIHELAMHYKAISLVAPNEGFNIWSVYVTDDGWGQR